MIPNNDFNFAKDILHYIVNQDLDAPLQGQFSPEYSDQGLITTALKIIHKASQEGTRSQRRELSLVRHEIIALNALLLNNQLEERVQASLGIEMGEEAEKLEKMEIALPQTTIEKVIEIASRIWRVSLAMITDILLLPVAAVLLFIMLLQPNLNPVEPKTDAIPILLLHGSGFNESQWIFGRQFLKKPQYGSVFSLNYDGLVSNEHAKGIDDYAAGKVRDKILEIRELTGQDRIILIGHSMGGMIAGHYAEHFAAEDNIQVDHVMGIASPWRGSPALDCLMAGEDASKRYNQMSSESQFRQELVAQALNSERAGRRNYYSIGSETDPMVPGSVSMLTEDPRRQRMFSYMGHYGIVASPRVWWQIRSWLDVIYQIE